MYLVGALLFYLQVITGQIKGLRPCQTRHNDIYEYADVIPNAITFLSTLKDTGEEEQRTEDINYSPKVATCVEDRLYSAEIEILVFKNIRYSSRENC